MSCYVYLQQYYYKWFFMNAFLLFSFLSNFNILGVESVWQKNYIALLDFWACSDDYISIFHGLNGENKQCSDILLKTFRAVFIIDAYKNKYCLSYTYDSNEINKRDFGLSKEKVLLVLKVGRDLSISIAFSYYHKIL